MPETLLIGSGNRDKAAELTDLLHGLPWEVKCLKDFPEVVEPEENGDSFEANALIKASYYREKFGVACVADDSGLAVDALGGAPGVYSARYAGESCSYEDNNQKLLQELLGRPWRERTAHFCCCATFLPRTGDSPFVTLGRVDGHIALKPSGDKGFGYDPLFIPEEEDRSFAEMSAEEKHAISHRGRAFAALRQFLESLHATP